MTGYPLGPGGYGRRAGVHFLRATARAIAVVTTAKAGPAYFSDVDKDMEDSEVDSDGQRGVARNSEGRSLVLSTAVARWIQGLIRPACELPVWHMQDGAVAPPVGRPAFLACRLWAYPAGPSRRPGKAHRSRQRGGSFSCFRVRTFLRY